MSKARNKSWATFFTKCHILSVCVIAQLPVLLGLSTYKSCRFYKAIFLKKNTMY